jgi:GTPase Era involved in 16S rRNA processing
MTAVVSSPSATRVADRVDALGRFLGVVAAHAAVAASTEAVPAARELVTRARARLDLDATGHTVVALAGATGSGKSSLFNAIAGMDLSPSGVLRPTTDEAHACVWGDGNADTLLDWLGVSPSRRFRRESALDAEDEAPLRGVVLLDLPDLDSVATAHRREASRLVGVVDLVIWVLDPQKYADASVHDGYLRHMGPLRDVTVVVFNQTDRLAPSDVDRCLADLRRLVEVDGLAGVTVIGASATTGAGVGQLRVLLERAVAGRSAATARLSAELADAVAKLEPLVSSDPSASTPFFAESDVDDQVLADSFAHAAGVSAVAAEAGRDYRHRAAVPGWPFRRRSALRDRHPSSGGHRRRGRGPSRAAAEAAAGTPSSPSRGASVMGDVPPADPAAVGQAVRRLAASSSAGLPAPWPDEVRAAATADAERLPEELGRAVRDARPHRPRAIGWLFTRLVWWLAVAAVLVGLGWWIWSVVGSAPSWPKYGRAGLPAVLVAAGLVLSVALPLFGRLLAGARARRWRRRTERRLRDATASVAREAVRPVRAVLHDYAEARDAWRDAATP